MMMSEPLWPGDPVHVSACDVLQEQFPAVEAFVTTSTSKHNTTKYCYGDQIYFTCIDLICIPYTNYIDFQWSECYCQTLVLLQ